MNTNATVDLSEYEYSFLMTEVITHRLTLCLKTLALPYTFDIPNMIHIICMPILMVLCVIGNSFVFNVLKKINVKTAVSIFMRGLAVLDLAFIVLLMPLFTMAESYFIEAHCGSAVKYNTFFFMTTFVIICSLFIFVAMSCDLLYAVYMPFRYVNSRGRTIINIVISIVMSACLSGLAIIADNNESSMIGRAVISIVIQVSIAFIISSYILIVIKLRKQRKRVQCVHKTVVTHIKLQAIPSTTGNELSTKQTFERLVKLFAFI